MVTPDDNGLFASVASAPEGGGGSGGGGASGAGGGGGGGPGTPPGSAQTIQGGESCGNEFKINLAYGAGRNKFRGTGNTSGTESASSEAACQVGSDGPDRVHAITVDAPEGGYLTARLVRGEGKTDFDSVLYVRETCEGGAGAVCEDAFVLDRNDQREPADGGELLSIVVPPTSGPKTLFLYVDGVGATSGGRYELEVSLNKGDCEDPIPIVVEPGSPVRASFSNKIARNVLTHVCGNNGSLDVVYRVSRSEPGALRIKLDTGPISATDLALAFLQQACNGAVEPTQAKCDNSSNDDPTVTLGEAVWPGGQQSIDVVVDTGGGAAQERVLSIVFDPTGGTDF